MHPPGKFAGCTLNFEHCPIMHFIKWFSREMLCERSSLSEHFGSVQQDRISNTRYHGLLLTMIEHLVFLSPRRARLFAYGMSNINIQLTCRIKSTKSC